MAGKIDARLAELNITLPEPPAPVASYVPYVVSGKQVFISGQVTLADGGLKLLDHGREGFALSLEARMDLGHAVENHALRGVRNTVYDAIELVGELVDIFAIEWGNECLVEGTENLAGEDVAAVTLILNFRGSLTISINAVQQMA